MRRSGRKSFPGKVARHLGQQANLPAAAPTSSAAAKLLSDGFVAGKWPATAILAVEDVTAFRSALLADEEGRVVRRLVGKLDAWNSVRTSGTRSTTCS